jgi:hypothetical protein
LEAEHQDRVTLVGLDLMVVQAHLLEAVVEVRELLELPQMFQA